MINKNTYLHCLNFLNNLNSKTSNKNDIIFTYIPFQSTINNNNR